MSTSSRQPASPTASQTDQRARWVSEAVHNVGMDGFGVSDEWHADAAELVNGRIDAAELVRRTRSRLGVPD
ncbi:hypothetical protein BJY21_003077 [Kineosphaera limosa]|uniref:Antitoxin VbhA domain-containing protein n=1 Tax=Kineosphaera limosa NBRC 100340 TaxID=1184609 RepID=K6WA89_9MICO|nr:antitoxin VbhA family protein [Kineosphaera limosa]NYE01893.1 hypothetical protein [Kineosphaera limosa]GAB96120.1 hypothetical protein KILIM_032_00050 [Kineosphaera limosa NBRC 100340]